MDGSSAAATFHAFAGEHEHAPKLELQAQESARPQAVIRAGTEAKTIYVFDDWGRVLFLKE